MGIHAIRLVVVEKDVGQDQGPNLEPAVENAPLRKKMENVSTEPPNGSFLDRDHYLVFPCKPKDEVLVKRLGEACIGDCCRQALSGQGIRGCEAFREASP